MILKIDNVCSKDAQINEMKFKMKNQWNRFLNYLESFNVFNAKFRHNILFLIVWYFSEKDGFKSHKNTYNLMNTIGITNIKFHFGIFNPIIKILNMVGFHVHTISAFSLIIKAKRPGLLIGKRGEDINNLLKSFNSRYSYFFKPKHIHLVEEREYDIHSCMMVWNYNDTKEDYFD